MEEGLLNPYNLMKLAWEFIDKAQYTEAVASLVQTLHVAPKDSLLIRQAARMAAEIMLVDGDQHVNAIQLLCFSRVAPVHWLGTMGVAAKMLEQTTSRVGDVVLDLSDRRGALLVKSDKWCKACNSEKQENGSDCHPCPGCGVAYYCCRSHQVNDWQANHKFNCTVNKYKNQDLWNDTFTYEEKLDQLNQVIGAALTKK